jgi:hypothetical protein
MRYETRNQLDEVIADYVKALDRSSQAPGEEDRSAKHFRPLCNEVIRPAMEEFSHVLQEHGHKVRIFGHERTVELGGRSCNAEISMRVSPKGGDTFKDASHSEFDAVFKFDPAQDKMLTLVTQGSTPQGELRSFNQHPIEGVTIELVEQELLEMVRYGLNRAIRQVDTRHTTVSEVLS